MTSEKQNPYASSVTETVSNDPEIHESTERPLGISILSVLHLLGAMLLTGTTVLLCLSMVSAYTELTPIGEEFILAVAATATLTVLGFAAAVGMWRGMAWGWRIATFYYVYAIFRNGNAIVSTALITDELNVTGTDISMLYVKHGTRIAVQALLLLYMFKPKVLNFFHLEEINKGVAIGIHVAICLMIFAISTLIIYLS